MARIPDGSTVTVSGDTGDARLWIGEADLGRVRGARVEVGAIDAIVTTTSERATRVLVAGGHSRATPVLRMDPAGRKATWLVLSRSRFRLTRLRFRPFNQRWVLHRDVQGPPVLRVSTTPLGTRVSVVDGHGLHDDELDALVAGTLAVVLELPAAEHAGV